MIQNTRQADCAAHLMVAVVLVCCGVEQPWLLHMWLLPQHLQCVGDILQLPPLSAVSSTTDVQSICRFERQCWPLPPQRQCPNCHPEAAATTCLPHLSCTNFAVAAGCCGRQHRQLHILWQCPDHKRQWGAGCRLQGSDARCTDCTGHADEHTCQPDQKVTHKGQ